MSHNKYTVFCLGRFGDILVGLPIAYALAQQGETVQWLVSSDHKSIFDGVSYVKPLEWNGIYNDPAVAMRWLEKQNPGTIVNVQCYRHEDKQRLTDSYQKESWRIAGWLDKFGQLPLVFDRRDLSRELALSRKIPADPPKPFVLVSHNGISSPFDGGKDMMRRIIEQVGKTHNVIDLAEIRAFRIYDLLGIMDRASLIVSIDSVLLHLARACSTPVISILQDGWGGSVPPPSSVASFRYAEALADPSLVPSQVRAFIYKEAKAAVVTQNVGLIFHVVDIHGQTDRHARAQESWDVLYKNGVIPVHLPDGPYSRNSLSIGDNRAVPFLKDVLMAAMNRAADDDVILWTNDDVTLDPRIVDWAKKTVGKFGAASMRRNGDKPMPHIGRDLFAFTKKWLTDNWANIPEFFLASPAFDLVLAALIRKQCGVHSTLKNMFEDFPPADAKERYVHHEDHPSAWAGENEMVYPANNYNRLLAHNWCVANMATLSL